MLRRRLMSIYLFRDTLGCRVWRGREAMSVCFFFQAEDGIRDLTVTGVQTCALPILAGFAGARGAGSISMVAAFQRSGPASMDGFVVYVPARAPLRGRDGDLVSGGQDRKSVV